MKAENLGKIKKLENEARQRILERGKIEFRLEPELHSAILYLAKERKLPVGPMIRQWVKERLDQETLNCAPQSQLDVIEQKIDQLLSKQARAESA
jgi:hypothetical protein